MLRRVGAVSRRRLPAVVGASFVIAVLLWAGFACAGTGTAATTARGVTAASIPVESTDAAATTPLATMPAAPPPTTAPTTAPITLAPSTSSSTTSTAAPLAPLIVLDPGHSGSSLTTIDPATQIRDEEYLNTPETQNMFEVATLLKGKLEAAGYRVLMTKQAWNDTVAKRDRVNFANENGAALGVSIHTSGHSFGHYGQIYVQRMDSYRENIHGQKVYFALPDVAALSAQYGKIFLEERRKIEGSSVVITVNSGWGERGLAPGNLPIVQLFSEVPWILNEAGVPKNEAEKDLYAQSLFNSIVKCVPNPLR
jgi:hypothetical protein